MNVEFDVKLQPKDLFQFNMYQTYHSSQGPASIAITIIVLVLAVVQYMRGYYSYTALYCGMAVLFLVYIPVSLWRRAQATLKKNEVLANTLHYVVNEKGIGVQQGKDTGLLEWKLVYKVVATKNLVLVYSNRVNAYIIPREQLGEEYDALKAIVTEQLEKFRVKM